jgi:glycosyltransferase involved in cell wall biosynthesis
VTAFGRLTRREGAATASRAMRVLHVTPSFAPAWRYGGPIRVVLQLCQALRRAGVEVEVATTNCDGPEDLDVPLDRSTEFERVPVRYFRRWPRADYAFSTSLAAFLSRETRHFDLVHITSTFSFPALAAGIAARRSGIPYIVSPHGSLEDWSLRQKRVKKLPYWVLFERRHLSRASAIHCTAETERTSVLRQIPSAPTIVVPNGIEPVIVDPSQPRSGEQVVFLGRVHPKKGFDVLIPALTTVARAFPEVETIVAGPDEGGYWSAVQHWIDQASPRPRVKYVGAVNGDDRFRLLAASTVFVLPSHSENFGVSILEAMACGTPVVVSRNCPWKVVEDVGAGFWTVNTPAAVADALLQVLRDPLEARRMGEAGRRLAANYAWDAIGLEMKQEYQYIVDASRKQRATGIKARPSPAGH